MRETIHFMGIGGISMAGLARHLAAEGHEVSGCDGAPSATLDALRDEGIDVHVGHDAGHVTSARRLVVSAAIPDDAPEVVAARSAGVPVVRRIDVLRDLCTRYRTIGVTGSHGKSTTSAMVATVLVARGEDPAVQLGAVHPHLGGVMRFGRGPALVAEVDESDVGFSQLHVNVAVITNLEDDHVAGDHSERRTYHPTVEALEEAIETYARQAQTAVFCSDWPVLTRLIAGHDDAWTYGTAPGCDYRIDEVHLSPSSVRCRVVPGSRVDPNGASVEVVLSVPGRHNALNAVAAMAACHRMGVPLHDSAAALASFPGVGRRWQVWTRAHDVWIVDDYAVHPTEVRATLDVARSTGRRVTAVLQPHRWVRAARHWQGLADACAAADEVVVLDVYAAGEAPVPGVSVDAIVERIRAHGIDARRSTTAGCVAELAAAARPGDLIVTLGAGDVWTVARDVTARVEQRR